MISTILIRIFMLRSMAWENPTTQTLCRIMSISLSTPPSTGRGRYCRKRRRLIPTASLPFIMILWTSTGWLFLKNKYLHNYKVPLRLAHVDGRSLRSASSFTFSNNAFNEDSYSDVFDPSFDIEKNVTVYANLNIFVSFHFWTIECGQHPLEYSLWVPEAIPQ